MFTNEKIKKKVFKNYNSKNLTLHFKIEKYSFAAYNFFKKNLLTFDSMF